MEQPHTFRRLARSHAHDAKLDHRRHVGAVELEDAGVPRSCAGHVVAQEGEIAEASQSLDEVGHPLQDAFERDLGVGIPVLRDLHLGERDERLRECRALARRVFQDGGGLVELSGESQVVAQHNRVFRRQLARLFAGCACRRTARSCLPADA